MTLKKLVSGLALFAGVLAASFGFLAQPAQSQAAGGGAAAVGALAAQQMAVNQAFAQPDSQSYGGQSRDREGWQTAGVWMLLSFMAIAVVICGVAIVRFVFDI